MTDNTTTFTNSHASHHLLAIYAMGASSETLRAAYHTHVVYQRAAFASPEVIDKSNWKDHLGDEKLVPFTRYCRISLADIFGCQILPGLCRLLVQRAPLILRSRGT